MSRPQCKRDYDTRYRVSPAGRARTRRYNAGPLAKAAAKRYRHTDSFREHAKFRNRSWRAARRIKENAL